MKRVNKRSEKVFENRTNLYASEQKNSIKKQMIS
ncbi:MAG: hypothetical protein PWQ54_195 [Bacteroidales bacterium]|jgi:hypothetical protein|nr:hypothetical protein [Bacteroidales bacterium]